jgi:hypothetical protein
VRTAPPLSAEVPAILAHDAAVSQDRRVHVARREEDRERWMAYEQVATSDTPALIVYLLDVSASMNKPFGSKRRIDVVRDGLKAAFEKMIYRSTKGARIAPRYRIALYAYTDGVYDLMDGVKTIDHIARLGVPPLEARTTTDTARAFAQVEKLLRAELPNQRANPAPLVCHLTDGEYTADDPAPIARRIRELRVPDGNVLIENIFISDRVLVEPVGDVTRWPGVTADTPLAHPYAETLREMSSPLPATYRALLNGNGYQLREGCCMLLPGESPELISLAFQMSGVSGEQHAADPAWRA